MLQPLPFPSPSHRSAKSLPETPGIVVLFSRQNENGDAEFSSSAELIPGDPAAALKRLIDASEITGKQGETRRLGLDSEQTPLVYVAGIGESAKLTRSNVFDIAATVVRSLMDQPREEITFVVGDEIETQHHDVLVAGAVAACEGQNLYHNEPSTHVPGGINWVGVEQSAIDRGNPIGTSINFTKRLVNEPPTIMNPGAFADHAEAVAKETGLDCEVWDEKRLAKEGCRAILAVGRASTSPPRLVILRHNGGGDEAPIAIVGKGVTFDSGGLSLKPSEGMKDMKCDMAGAATVVGVMRALAELGVARNVIGLCGLAENMVSGDSYKLGDVIETRSGKTIEILNTDAEGRVVLADTLDVAVQNEPSAIVDLATLTGACLVALGQEVAGLMTNDQTLCDRVSAAAEIEDEPVWQLPMFSLYNDKVKSKVADIRNIGEGRWGGAITAAKFLENFVGETPWVHIDIAGPAFADSPKPHRDGGATGVMVRSLIRWIESGS